MREGWNVDIEFLLTACHERGAGYRRLSTLQHFGISAFRSEDSEVAVHASCPEE